MIWRRFGGLTAMLFVGAALGGFSAQLAAEPTHESKEAAPKNVAREASKETATKSPPGLALKPQTTIAKQKDGTLLIAGRSLRCGRNRNVLDRGLPNLGLAAPGVLVFNPRELNRWSDTVRLFVYHHECGHHNVGGSEMGADCWAVQQGVRDGWLTAEGLDQVCRSFGGGPATSTHPSGAARCANLNRCFTTTVTALAKAAKGTATADAKARIAPPPSPATDAGPKLIQEPALKRSGMRPSAEGR